ncbi:hypothetical protein cyc_06228 [Cyclospora cayetanensis]|uniref:Tetratricopeptide repeat-containing protein n=1 Tax=Cyclospora cayetanensis TaxID=88456 RepID=A0A1D3D4J8_9EIME|nr:hypothetical protein cyc_06228 [Cyclospora cayetanensis]
MESLSGEAAESPAHAAATAPSRQSDPITERTATSAAAARSVYTPHLSAGGGTSLVQPPPLAAAPAAASARLPAGAAAVENTSDPPVACASAAMHPGVAQQPPAASPQGLLAPSPSPFPLSSLPLHDLHDPLHPPTPPPPPCGLPRPPSSFATRVVAAPVAAAEEEIAALISARDTRTAANLLLEKLKARRRGAFDFLMRSLSKLQPPWPPLRCQTAVAISRIASSLCISCTYGDAILCLQQPPAKALAPDVYLRWMAIRYFCLLRLRHCKQQLKEAAAGGADAAGIASTAAEAAAGSGDRPTDLQRLWKARLLRTGCLLALVLSAANYPEEALRVLKQVLALDAKSAPALSLMGRIALKMGCTDCAEQYFSYADCVGTPDTALSSTNHGLLLLFNRRIAPAVDAFEAAVHACGSSSLVSPLSVAAMPMNGCEGPLGSPTPSAAEGRDPWKTACDMFCPPAHAVCCNNAAVARFYSKRLADATAALEGLVHGNPDGVFPSSVRNLITLYEFAANRESCLALLQDLQTAARGDPQIQQLLTGN